MKKYLLAFILGTCSTIANAVNTLNEQGTDTNKAITFQVKANTHDVYWKNTEANLTGNREAFDFNEDLMTQATKDQTSVFVNIRELAWAVAKVDYYIQIQDKYIKIAPKINLDDTDMPYGNTRIQGKSIVTCGDTVLN